MNANGTVKKMRPTSIMLDKNSLRELRELALRQSLRSGQNVTTSSLVRHIVEDYLDARRQRAERKGESTVMAA